MNFRSHKQSYKDKNAVMNPKEDWLIFEDTHEAIVDRETWELAQKLRKTPKRIDTLGEANPLTGLLYCADCGEKVIRPTQEKAVKKQLEDTMQEKPSLIMLLNAKQETSRLLGEDAEERQARQMVMQRQKEQRTVPQNQSKKKEHWER